MTVRDFFDLMTCYAELNSRVWLGDCPTRAPRTRVIAHSTFPAYTVIVFKLDIHKQNDNRMTTESYDLTTADGWKDAVTSLRKVPLIGTMYAPYFWVADRIIEAVSPAKAVEKQAQQHPTS